jgi:hypothetical protein
MFNYYPTIDLQQKCVAETETMPMALVGSLGMIHNAVMSLSPEERWVRDHPAPPGS